MTLAQLLARVRAASDAPAPSDAEWRAYIAAAWADIARSLDEAERERARRLRGES